MAAHPKRIEIGAEERPVLERWANARAVERRLVDRARIVLLAGEGRPAREIAERVGCSLPTVKTWRSRYERDGLDGLRDRPKTGRPLTHGPEVRAKLIALACTRPPDTPEGVRRERWTHAELAAQVGMSESQAHVILRAADLRPHLTEQWVMSELGPGFDAQAAEVCGLYLDPPKNAIVVSIDEKTSIRAKQPIRTEISLQPGKPTRREFEYERHGTVALLAVLVVHTGEIKGEAYARNSRLEFLDFLELLEREIPAGKAGTRDPRQPPSAQDARGDRVAGDAPALALPLHPHPRLLANVQIELCFSILSRRLLKRGIFASKQDLKTQLLAFIEHYNPLAKPFA